MRLLKRKNFTWLSIVLCLALLFSCTVVLADVEPNWDKSSLKENGQGSGTGINVLKVTKVVEGTDPDDSDYSVSIIKADSQEDGSTYPISVGNNTIDNLSVGGYTITETDSHNADDVDVTPSNFSITTGTEYIWASFANGGSDMTGPVNWYLYFSTPGDGDPYDHGNGTLISQGSFGPIDSGESDVIEYYLTEDDTPGKYKFVVDQRLGHPGNSHPQSNTITVSSIIPANPEVTITNTFEPSSNPKLIVEKTFVDYPDDVTKTATVTVSGGNDFSGSNTFTANGTWEVTEINLWRNLYHQQKIL
ncbi:MAG: hypothetical protein ACOX0F_03210 [Syntrophomonadaceae bacterium]